MIDNFKGCVTITLGRSGQVVKRGGIASDDDYSDSKQVVGSKRSVRDRLGSNYDGYMSRESSSKRQRGESSLTSLGSNAVEDVHIGRNDLRYKLMQKEASKRGQSYGDRKPVDLREKLSKKVQPLGPPVRRFDAKQSSPEPGDISMLRQVPSTRSSDDIRRTDSSRGSNPPWTLDQISSRSPDRNRAGSSRYLSPPRNVDERWRLSPPRIVDERRRLSPPRIVNERRRLSPPRIVDERRWLSPPRIVDERRRVSPLRNVDEPLLLSPPRIVDERQRISPPRNVDERRQLPLNREADDIRTVSYTNRRISPDRTTASSSFTPPRNVDERQRIPLNRAVDDMRTVSYMSKRISPDRTIRSSRFLSPPRNADQQRRIPLNRTFDDVRNVTHMSKRTSPVATGSSRFLSPPRNVYLRQQINPTFDDMRNVPYMSKDVSDAPTANSPAVFTKLLIPSTSAIPVAPPPVQLKLHPTPANPAAPLLGQPPPLGGIVPKNPFGFPIGALPIEEPQTVEDLLQSLGLGKYAINFKVEEVDLLSLKQMGENDLKEMQIPMGPRKKILRALMALSKRPHP